MARKGRHHRGGRTTPKGTRPQRTRPRHLRAVDEHGGGDHREPDLLDDLRRALAAPHPLPLLGLASGIQAALEARDQPTPPFSGAVEEPVISAAEVLDTFFDVDTVETSALLYAMSRLSGDPALVRRVEREIGRRDHRLPRWLDRIEDVEVTGSVEVFDHFGDAENVMVGLRFAGGAPLTTVLLIDHNVGVAATDGFASDQSLDELLRTAVADAAADGIRADDLDPADARARMLEAIEAGARYWPPFETDTWPSARPLVRWAAGLLPGGGSGHEWREWSEEDRHELSDRFLGSDEGADLRDPATPALRHQRGLLDDLLWLATGYHGGDPFRWSPARAERILLDLVPRKFTYPPAELKQFPALLRRFVRWAHGASAVPAWATDEVVAAIEALEDAYRDAISAKRAVGPLALLEAVGAVDHDDLEAQGELFDPSAADASGSSIGPEELAALARLGTDDHVEDDLPPVLEHLLVRRVAGVTSPAEDAVLEDLAVRGVLGHLATLLDRRSWEQQNFDDLTERFGGAEGLDALHADPLPDEPFDWSVVPDDGVEKVGEILRLVDDACDALLDVEHRTACRRLLARAVAGEPELLRRKGRAETAAGAIVWVIGKANRTVAQPGSSVSGKDLGAQLGVSPSFSQRAEVLCRAAGVVRRGHRGDIGDPTLLTAATRENIIGIRRYLELRIAEHGG